jgi:hypothetical protein
MSDKICGHAKSFSTRCIECELISAREGLAWAKDSFAQYSKLVAKLEAEQLMAASLSLSRPLRADEPAHPSQQLDTPDNADVGGASK